MADPGEVRRLTTWNPGMALPQWLQETQAPPEAAQTVSVPSGDPGAEQHLSRVAALGGTHAHKFIPCNDSLTQPKGLYYPSKLSPPSMGLRQPIWTLQRNV